MQEYPNCRAWMLLYKKVYHKKISFNSSITNETSRSFWFATSLFKRRCRNTKALHPYLKVFDLDIQKLIADHHQRIVTCPSKLSRYFRPTRRICPRTMDKSKLHYPFQSSRLRCFLSRRLTMSWETEDPQLIASLLFLELRLILVIYLMLPLVPATDPGDRNTVVIHPNPIHVILVLVSPSSLKNSASWFILGNNFSNAGVIISWSNLFWRELTIIFLINCLW